MAHTKVTKTYSQNTGDPNTFSYSGSFDVFKGTEVVVLLDNVQLTFTASTINESASPREYSVDTSAKTVHIGGGNLSSGTIIIRPETDMGAPTPRATYSPGSSVTAEDLNNNQTQLMRKAMEYDETKLSTTGDTMTGDLTMGEDQTIIFEGATDDGYETTLTVADPTADRTVTLPNATDTLVGKATTDTLTNKTVALGSNTVSGTFAQFNTAVTDATIISTTSSDSLSNKTLTSAVLNGSISGTSIKDEDNMSSDSATHLATQQSIKAYTDSGSQTLTNKTISADSNTLSGIAGSSFVVSNSSGNIDGSASQKAIPSGTVVGTSDSQTLTNKSIDSDNNTITNIVNADIKAGAAIAHNKLANVTDGQILVGNGANVPTAVAVSGDVTIANTGAVTIANNAVEIGMLGCEQTSGNLTSSDSHIPTSAAVATYVQGKIDPIGGLEVIEDKDSFPETQPAAGVIISIENAGGIVVSSNSSTTPDTISSDTQVTINQFPNDITGTIADRVGLMVTSTGSSQIYNYHKALLKEADLVNLSTDIQDFGNRYRVGTKTSDSDSSNDDGDLFFDTGANKMYVYDGAYGSGGSWKEVTSAGDFKILTVKDHDQAVGGSGPTFNGSNEEFDLFDGSADASVTNAQQLLVVLNGVIQKPNASWAADGEGYALNDTHGIKFCDPPPSNSTLFVTQIGTATTISTPGTGSISNANMFAGGVINAAAIGTGAVTAAKIGVLDGHLQFGDGIKAKFGAGDDIEIYHESNTSNIKNTTGNLVISDTDGDIHIQAKNGEHSIVAHADGSVKLYHNNIAKSETTTAGINLDNSGGTTGKGKLTFGNSGQQYIEGLDTGNGGSGSYLSFGDGGAEYLRIDNAGDVGIGETSPSYKTDIKVTDTTAYDEDSAASTQNQLRINNAGASGVAGIRFDAEPSSGSAGYASIRTIAPASGSADLIFSTRNSSTFGEKLRITSGGFIKYSGSSTADETNKVGRFLMPSHDTNEEDVQYFQMENEGSMNQLTFGGGSSSYNAATKLVFRTAAVDTVNGTSRFEIDSSGIAHFNGDVKVLSGDIQMGNGRGIDFSATSDTGGKTSETLDDYEEGTFTPTLTNGPSISDNTGRYIKIGKVVHCFWAFTTAANGPASHCRMHLPFTMVNTNPNCGGTAWDYNTSEIDGHISVNSDAVFFYQNGSSLNGNNAQIQNQIFRACSTYEVA